MWCFVAYVYNGGERERERRRVRDGESTLQDHIIYNEMRIALHMCLPDNFQVCWPPATALSVFHGNLPQKICDTTSPMFIMGNLFSPHGESTSWNFPAKIKNSLRPIPSFDMMSKFPGWSHSRRRRYVNKLLAERRIMLTCSSEQNQHPSESIRTAKKAHFNYFELKPKRSYYLFLTTFQKDQGQLTPLSTWFQYP